MPERVAVMIRIFRMAADGIGRKKIADILNAEGVAAPGQSHRKEGKIGGWKGSTITNMLQNERYSGRGWQWRNTSMVTDPDTQGKTSRPNTPDKIVHMDKQLREELRIVPQDLWDKVQTRRETTKRRKARARKNDERFFGDRSGKSGPDHMLSGILRCRECGGLYSLLSGKSGGYYGCFLSSQNGNCTTTALLRRTRMEDAVREALHFCYSRPSWLEHITSILNKWIDATRKDCPRNREVVLRELTQVDKELGNLVAYIASGKASEAVSEALATKERQRHNLEAELRKLAVIESQKERITADVLEPRLGSLVRQLENDPKVANQAMRRLFPGGLQLIAPTDSRHRGTWIAHANVSGADILFADPDVHMKGIPKNPERAGPGEAQPWFSNGRTGRAIPDLHAFLPVS
ncbi:recombinase family protein [Myxococcota bacterium]